MLNNIVGVLGVGGAAVVGDFESIATLNAAAGGSASLEFTSIPSTYKHLQIRYIARTTDASQNNLAIQFNGDTTAKYAAQLIYGDGTSAASGGGANQNNGTYISISNSSRGANTFSVGIIDIPDYTNTTTNKTIRAFSGRDDNSAGVVILSGNLWFNTPAAITSIKLFPQTSGNLVQYSTFALYGIKG